MLRYHLSRIPQSQRNHRTLPSHPPTKPTLPHHDSHDRAPVDVSDRTVRQMYAPPFLEAVRAGVRTAMECYIEVGGVPMVSNREYLIDLLRHEMGFEGMMITDWKEVRDCVGGEAASFLHTCIDRCGYTCIHRILTD